MGSRGAQRWSAILRAEEALRRKCSSPRSCTTRGRLCNILCRRCARHEISRSSACRRRHRSNQIPGRSAGRARRRSGVWRSERSVVRCAAPPQRANYLGRRAIYRFLCALRTKGPALRWTGPARDLRLCRRDPRAWCCPWRAGRLSTAEIRAGGRRAGFLNRGGSPAGVAFGAPTTCCHDLDETAWAAGRSWRRDGRGWAARSLSGPDLLSGGSRSYATRWSSATRTPAGRRTTKSVAAGLERSFPPGNRRGCTRRFTRGPPPATGCSAIVAPGRELRERR